MRVWRMRTGISITLKTADRRRLTALARDRNTAQKHVWRAEIVLLSAAGVGNNEIMRRTGTSKTCVWRWQERFMQEGYDGLLRDKTRRSRISPLAPDITGRVVTLTQTNPPAEATHWDLRDDGEDRRDQRQFRSTHLACARLAAAPGQTVQALYRPQFITKLRDIVGLYVDPPAARPHCSPLSTSSTAPSSGATCSITDTRSSSAFS